MSNCEVTVRVPQGGGDLWWVYRKLAPFYDRVNFRICILNDHEVQTRAEPFVRILPKIGDVSFAKVDPTEYEAVMRGQYRLPDLLGRESYDYACNFFLEKGVRIEDIDPGYPVDWDFRVPVYEPVLPYEEFLLVYISGYRAPFVWTPEEWSLFLRDVRGDLPVIFLGANYDLGVLAEAQERTPNSMMIINRDAPEFLGIMRQCKLFVGSQSGLNILADHIDVPQVMLYFPFHKDLMFSWQKPGNYQHDVYNAFCFDEDKEIIKKRCKDLIK